jgi:hypothetical protein
LRYRVLEAVMFCHARLATNLALPIALVAQLRLALMRDWQVAEFIDHLFWHRRASLAVAPGESTAHKYLG